ncbi:MAG TPA: tRNA (cytidine(56)-2'-O)-methyltransferase [Methanospirillum sp.]|uniref:tRNA (cytidine(56)-2'-O)-methyltransferase n=1 Tax=Methanospirillum sp. TaxID=45200 RepID=UPI002CBD7464|nr:tRNA (cytidine(56)-2'-O)-methyltransferase [Methanospirillum sp.]HOJ97066.1 tRNA (cytidine(56)-2'-O)-methyltransferase [Methanospirillum sp.]HOL42292.1 tRNA (cytidine(56)-2'-O)-methyltransferase [Methanospirillum sp.]HPP76656.1 tRNA (cytidine(56)-2'-O)-methyltransferase [Methanospirillum sp.]
MIVVLRIGHRPQRDMRVTTHVGLTARALGADGMYIAADDRGVVQSIRDVADRFGGTFFVEDKIGWNSCIRNWKKEGGCVVHLTMFGVNLPDVEEEIRKKEKILVIVGAEKVPGDLYQLADYNVAVTNQPHSEIAGLAVFLDHIAENALCREFPGAKVRVHPNPCGKTVEEL